MATPVAVACAVALAGCTADRLNNISAAQPRGATVAFESIDGPPPAHFQTLVRALNDEAQARQLAVLSREQPSAYRVRGYLAAEVAGNKTNISWVWDVFDGEQNRSLRITGAETVDGRRQDAWQAVDDAMLKRIAASTMEQLATFLTAPGIAPGTPDTGAAAQVAFVGPDAGTPEAAGIFRLFQPHADPLPAGAERPAPAVLPDSVPLPPRRRSPVAALGPDQTLTLAADARH